MFVLGLCLVKQGGLGFMVSLCLGLCLVKEEGFGEGRRLMFDG